jgi:hypothetical protein
MRESRESITRGGDVEGKEVFRTHSIGRKSNADCTPDVMESLVLSLLAAPLALALVEFATSQSRVCRVRTALCFTWKTSTELLALYHGNDASDGPVIRTRSVNCGVQVLVRSFLRVLSVDMGFRSEHVASLGIVG